MKEISIDAVLDNVAVVTDFVNEQLENMNCPKKVLFQIDIAIDELFSNIARYAYSPGTGNALVKFEAISEPLSVRIIFIDSGKPFNPLQTEDPDISLSKDEREPGGLGIFLTKKIMDNIDYEYKDGHNILTIMKKL